MRFLFTLFFIGILSSCAQGKKPVLGDSEFQRTMNAEFKDASTSPLKNKDRSSFESLDFFPVDSSFVITAHLTETPNTEYFEMQTTTSRVSKERVFGVLEFEIDGNTYKLNVYQGEDMLTTEGFEDYLFLPFLDNTNGDTTYGGGRYIDLRIPKSDEIIIDFNTAYNPYCAYNEKYSCPIVPRENYIATQITAGVKDYVK